LPLQFPEGENAESLGLDGTETFSFTGIAALNDGPIPKTVAVSATKEDGTSVEFDAAVRIDTPGEAEYFRNGGILQYVLRSLAACRPCAREHGPAAAEPLKQARRGWSDLAGRACSRPGRVRARRRVLRHGEFRCLPDRGPGAMTSRPGRRPWDASQPQCERIGRSNSGRAESCGRPLTAHSCAGRLHRDAEAPRFRETPVKMCTSVTMSNVDPGQDVVR